jgi:hypothetical protein
MKQQPNLNNMPQMIPTTNSTENFFRGKGMEIYTFIFKTKSN